MSKVTILVLTAVIALAYGAVEQEVCCGDLGCFNTGPPFSAFGRIALLPECPRQINTQFWLYTRKNSDVGKEISNLDFHALRNSYYDGSKPTKFIIHGWIDSPGLGAWMKQMAQKFLIEDDVNAIVVDWHGGGRSLYAQAVANCRTVGAQIAQLSDFLIEQKGGDYGKFHLLGHSLGSHVAGYAGERMPGLARITGMDPADPYFQNMTAAVRLDETDADFVDIVHTDANDITSILNPFNNMNGMGLWQPSGHVDVYANGGKQQPGCGDHGPIRIILTDGIVEGMRDIVACAHMRGYEYVLDTIGANCPWRAYNCKSWDEFKTGRCLRNCPKTGDKTKVCNAVGTLATKPSDGSVNNVYWMTTSDKSHYCRYHFHIQLKISSQKNKDQKGKAWVKLSGDRVTTDFIQLGEDNFYMKAGATYDFLITTKDEISTITSLEFKWEHDAHFYEISQWHLTKPTIYVESVETYSGEFQKEKKFCDTEGELKSKKSHKYTRAC